MDVEVQVLVYQGVFIDNTFEAGFFQMDNAIPHSLSRTVLELPWYGCLTHCLQSFMHTDTGTCTVHASHV